MKDFLVLNGDRERWIKFLSIRTCHSKVNSLKVIWKKPINIPLFQVLNTVMALLYSFLVSKNQITLPIVTDRLLMVTLRSTCTY